MIKQKFASPIDTEYLRKLQERLNLDKTTDVARAAMTLLYWASEEIDDDRMILSSKKDGEDVHRLVMPELTARH